MGDLRELVLLSLESVGMHSRLIAAESLFSRPISIISSLSSAAASLDNDGTLDIASLEDKSPLDFLLASRIAAEILQDSSIRKDKIEKSSGNARHKEVKQINCAEEEIKDVMEIWNKPYGWFFLPGEKIPLVK